MEVTTIRATEKPEQLVCEAARGDYYDGFVGDSSFPELMAETNHDESHREAVEELFGDGIVTELDCKKYALLERLFRRGHWGPYEHPQITLAIKGISRSCMAQLTRHRHATFDVQSQRYVDFSEKDDPVAVPRSLTDPDHFTRGEGEINVSNREEWEAVYDGEAERLVEQYEALIEAGVPKEDARFILPIGTKVNLTVSMSARSLLHIEDMRKKANAQYEIREMTEMVHEEFVDWMPMTAKLYEEHGPHKIAP